MNPSDISNALIYGIPVVGYVTLYRSFDFILARKTPTAATCTRGDPESFAGNVAPRHGIHIAVATSHEEHETALELVRARYRWRGYDVPVSDSHASSDANQDGGQEITFIAKEGAVALGTLTLGLDGPKGLLAEATHDGVIDAARARGRKVCELTRLAIAQSANSKSILSSLLAAAHLVGREIYAVTDVFIEVNPRHVGFYSRLLGFVVAAGEKVCERVRAPSVLLRLELDALEERLARMDVGPLMAKAA